MSILPHLVSERSFLLDYLFKHLTHLKRTKVKQLLKYGSVRVNGRVVTFHRHELKVGDTIDLLREREALAERIKSQFDFPIVYEDSDLLVVEKPAGLLTMGTDREKENTLYFKLTAYARAKSKDGRGRVFIVHRLDREASGLVVFAKNEAAKFMLQNHWSGVVKKYYAVTEGVPTQKEGRMESYLREDAFRRVYSTPRRSQDSKHAVTHYRLLGGNGRYALLDVRLESGRKNQIRIHLSDLGHPIVGDTKYGSASDPLRRLGLHAYYLSLLHPTKGKLKIFQSNLPSQFKVLLKIFF